MERFKRNLLRKSVRKTLIVLFILIILFCLFIRLTPPILITFPFKESFVQINIHKGFHAFFPKDNNSMYYFNNTLQPQIITPAKTSYEGMESLPYFQIWLPKMPQISLPKFPSIKLPTANLPEPQTSNPPQAIPQGKNPKKDHLTSKQLNLTFTFPPGYDLEYKPQELGNTEIFNISKREDNRDNWMSIQIINSEKCEVKSEENVVTVGQTLNVAGKWPLVVTKNHPRYGSREQKGMTCLDNNKTLQMYRYVDDSGGEIETQFDKILETAVYKP